MVRRPPKNGARIFSVGRAGLLGKIPPLGIGRHLFGGVGEKFSYVKEQTGFLYPPLEAWGLLVCNGQEPQARLAALFDELGRRRMTNVLVEGGSRLLGSLFDARLIDEVHIFIAPKLAGGGEAPGPIAGRGIDAMAAALALDEVAVERLDGDLYLRGRVRRGARPQHR